MQPANFYPQAFSLNGDEIVLTADVLTLSGTVQESMAPYYIGYVNFDNMPSLWKMHTISIDSNTIIVDDIIENYGWGFDYHWNDMDGSDLAYMRPCFIIESNGAKTDLYGGYSHHFVNHAIIASANFSNAYRLCFTYIAVPTGWLTDDDSCIYSAWAGHYNELRTIHVETTYEQIYDFLENDGTFTLSNLYYDTRNNTVTLSKSDFGEDTHTAKMVSAETPGYTVFIQITNFYAYGMQAYIQSNATKTVSRFSPFFAMSIKGDGAGVADQKAMVCPNHLCQESGALLNVYFDGVQSNAQQILSVSVESSNKIKAGSTYMGNFKILNGLTQQDFRERGNQNRDYYWYADAGIIQGKILVQGTNQLFCRVVCPLEIEDLRRIVCFTNNKNETAVTSLNPHLANFTGSRSYTTDYTTALFEKATSNPLEQRISANFVDIADQLCLWQYPNIDIAVNRFTEDDIPEYTPPSPPDEGENIGDKITRPASIGVGGTNGFVTQYALNRADVAQLGALLWTSFVDQDYWQNYLFSLALDTGTFQLSGLLNFFVSLKVYPFPLINIDSFSQWGSDMYIGTGIVPLHFNNPLHVINNYCDYISGGYIDIPRYFNDYRDYINTEISLYLPFCGTVQLNPGDVIGNRIDIQYAIDFATGGCIAYVDLTTGDGAGYPVGALPGQIGADIPLTATAAGEVAARFIGDGLNVAGMIGGEVGRIGSGVAGALGGNPSGGSGGGSVFAGVAGMYGGAGAAMAADLAPGLARQGLQMLQRGAVGAPMLSGGRGFAAFGAPSKPYVQIRRGIYPEVTGLHTVAGAPAAATTTISSLSGFIQGSVKADGLSCHQAEKEEIIALIASGIYV